MKREPSLWRRFPFHSAHRTEETMASESLEERFKNFVDQLNEEQRDSLRKLLETTAVTAWTEAERESKRRQYNLEKTGIRSDTHTCRGCGIDFVSLEEAVNTLDRDGGCVGCFHKTKWG
ncbi:hypothetical protein SEA_HARAMBE_59 [Gordonia phage Harambe]|uniref:Uncharacterized protein n=11 Tax=Woesvirus woes TaxID=1982751 RepID=A0A2H4PG03_9CAUD|nr:hypothetical protein SEA_ANAMIKA_59 [Gordonia phage Anamika]QAX94342.1 hypothetical protein SEA_GUILLAUME_59 [Gordonia phage Guillaume]QAX94665.1 hypothetical protein SEA_HARAMBE_59 [Gordonia phage Harambe]QAX95328.1 hypothetical protein SEA_HELLO_59 [Gordonia phage Hello]QAX95420.1 hypothetical protein SEA_NEOEVIE_59 [Gordonia phage Neoevie]QBP30336.1 hypothetical protein SEA_JORMUNGANDR_59 [Gordonia phage Jormungandr]QBP30631.1 hypothetical protein SEA_LAHIRIUM_59 [Gordonia phage Lahiriu